MLRPIICLFSLFVFCLSVNAQNRTVDSLEQIVVNSVDAIERSDALYELQKIFIRKDPKRTKRYCRQCIEIAEKGGYQKGLGTCLNVYGIVYQFQQELDSAEVLFEKTLEIGYSLNDTLLILKGIANLGLNHRHAGEYDKAIDYYWQAMRISEQRNNIGDQARNFTEIGNIYIRTKDYVRAIEFQRKAKVLFQQVNDKIGVSNVDNSLGVIFENTDNLDSALFYYEKSAAVKKEWEDWFGWTNTKNNICGIYADRRELDKAILCLEEIIPVHKRIKNQNGLAISLTNISNYYNKKGNDTDDTNMHRKGVEYALEALELAEKTNNLFLQEETCGNLHVLYYQLGNYKEGYKYYEKRFKLNDSLLNESRIQQFADMQTKYETEKKEQKIALQQLEIENKNQKLNFQKSLGVTVVIGLITLFSFIFWRNKKQAESDRQKAEIKYQENLLLATVESVEAERKRISKDLHDGIGQQLSGLKMAWQQLADKLKNNFPDDLNKLNNLTNILNDAAKEVRNISHQMMPAALRELGLVAALEDMLQKSLFNSPIKYEFEHMGVSGRFSENIEIGLYRIAQELINNIIKHSNAESVSVELFKTKTHLVLTVEDDGKGFNVENMEGVGNGINNISSRAKSVNGKVQFEQRSGSGVSATIRVPV